MHLAGDGEPLSDDRLTVEHVARYVEAAARAGVAEIAFTEHVYRFAVAADWIDHPGWRDGCTRDIGVYAGLLADAGAAGLPVRAGLELDWVPGRAGEIAAVCAAHDWDMVLGSYHWLGGREIDHRANSVWEVSSVEDVWERYVEGFCAAAASGIYDSMAHPDLAKVFGHRPQPRPLKLYRRMIEAATTGGVCVEVSTAGYRRALGELYPDPVLLSMFNAAGVPITLGSDAHSPDDVGRDFDRALAEVARAGYRSITGFRRRERYELPLTEARSRPRR